ncbi:hypothetical protein BGX21_003131, partial [Mortierella sp. AD011]
MSGSFAFNTEDTVLPDPLAIDWPSVGTGCPVEIQTKKPVGMDAVLVDYRCQHNHDLLAQTLSDMLLGANERNRIKLKVAESSNWNGIRAMLRMDENSMSERHCPSYSLPVIRGCEEDGVSSTDKEISETIKYGGESADLDRNYQR